MAEPCDVASASPSQFYSWDNTAIFSGRKAHRPWPTPTTESVPLTEVWGICRITATVFQRESTTGAGRPLFQYVWWPLSHCKGSEGGPFNCICTASSKVAVSRWLQTSETTRRLTRATNRPPTENDDDGEMAKVVNVSGTVSNQCRLFIVIL